MMEPKTQIERLHEHVDTLDAKVSSVSQRLSVLEVQLEDFTTQVAARLEWMQIRQAEVRDYRDYPAQLPAAVPPQYAAGRWKQRDGNVYGRYTYEGTAADQLDSWLRRSPPATD